MDYPPHILFPNTLNFNVLESYLGRELISKEKTRIKNFWSESKFNSKLNDLHNVCKKKNLSIPILTNLDGNCLFESLVYLGIGTDISKLRKIVSFLLYLYKDYKYLVPNDRTLKEMFNDTNEIEFVKSSNDYYSYTYETMCQDVSNLNSWNELPTQIMLMVISYVFKVEIIIITNTSEYESKINMFNNDTNKTNINIRTIHIGKIDESHYFPLTDYDEDIKLLYYDGCLIRLRNWVSEMEKLKMLEYDDSITNEYDNEIDNL